MSKSKFCKLLSVVLAVAICCTALCGSIIAVNAANADYTCTYTVTVGDQNNAVPFGSTKVKAQVKFDLPAGFGGGDFTVSLKDTKGNDIYSSISDAKVTAATPKDSGVSFDAKSSNCFINNGNQVEFLLGDGDLYTSATIEYTYNMSSYVNSNPGNTYPTTITNIKLAVEHDYATVNVTAASDSDASFHAHSAWLPDNTPKTEFTSADENHKVVSDSKCATCGQNDSEHKQVHPNYLTFDGATELGSVLNTGWIGLSGTTVDYNSDGNLNINVHGYTQYQSGTLVILVTDENGKEYYRSSDKQTSTFAGNGFNADEFMVNINNFSAKNIDKKLLITAVAINSNKVCYSRTEEFTLTDYCTDVIDENAVWADGTTDAQKTADKEVAASLLYYGASIDESVFNKTTTAPEDTTIKGTTTVTPVEKSIVKWGGTDSDKPKTLQESGMKGSGDSEEDPYIIETAAQLFYVVQYAGDDSINKFYKISDSVAVVDFNNGNLGLSDNTKHFKGTFDGNGVTIKNLKIFGYHAALFPNVSGNATIKNLKVDTASLTATSGNAGGLIANINGDYNTNITVSNCIIINSTVTVNDNGGAGIIVGTAGNGPYLTIENCFVSGNTATASSSYQSNSLICVGWKTNNYALNNTIVIGSNPTNRINNFNNVSTDYEMESSINGITQLTTQQMQGANALTTMNLSSTDWFATESGYPELRVFHSLQNIYTDDLSHTPTCAIKINGVACTVCGVAEQHTAGDCSCGYKSTVVPSISELLTQKYDSTVSGKVLTVLNANKTYTNKFESNTKFVSAYTANTNPTDSNSNLYLYTSSLILKTLPYITFTFVLLGDNATNLSNVKIKFTYGETTKEITGDDLIHNQGAGKFYAYRLKELPIVNLKDQVTVTVNGNNFGSYSAAGFAISAINYGSDYFYYAQAAKAIVLYSEMLSARKSVYA